MANYIITYKNQEFVFPNFSGALNNVIVPNGNDSLEARACPVSGERKDKMTDDEKAGFLNLQLTHGNIIADNWSTGVSEWVKFKDSTALLLMRVNSSILSGDFNGVQEKLDEVLSWLGNYQTLLLRNKGYVEQYRDEPYDRWGSGCGNNGRCKEKLCHSTGFWEGAIVQYNTIIPQIEEQIYLVSEVQNTINAIELGELNLDALGGVINSNSEQQEAEKTALAEASKRKGIFIALGVVALLVVLFFTFKIIKKKRG